MEDQEELLQCSYSDDESSGNEEQCLPADHQTNTHHYSIINGHSKSEFFVIKVLLVISATVMLISFPVYLESSNVVGDVFSIMLITPLFTAIVLISCIFLAKSCLKNYSIDVLRLPISVIKLAQLSLIFVLSGYFIIYALDRKRVSCHLQDPIKGIILVFSLIFYFFFCRKLMGLRRIFSATTIIVGLFIAVDYGLCNEFRCRGYERKLVSEDTGNWTLQTHVLWTTIYICGLGLFAFYYTLLERFLVNGDAMEPQSLTSSHLSTVSRSVSSLSSNPSHQQLPEDIHVLKRYSALHISLWLHIFGLIVTILLFWTDFTPYIGKARDPLETINNTVNGFICHFALNGANCKYFFLYAWSFNVSYIICGVCAIRFLIISQSAVYTVSTMTIALPLSGIWWSLVHVASPGSAPLIWAPSITGELICSLIGLPVVVLGSSLLCQSHFKDYRWSKLAATHVMSSNHLS